MNNIKASVISFLRNRYLHIILLSCIGAVVFVSLMGTTSFEVLAFELDVSIDVFDSGLTEIRIPPLGIIRSQTHSHINNILANSLKIAGDTSGLSKKSPPCNNKSTELLLQ